MGAPSTTPVLCCHYKIVSVWTMLVWNISSAMNTRSFKPKIGYGQNPCDMRLYHSTKVLKLLLWAMSSRQDLYVSSPTTATTGGKRSGSPTAPERDVCKSQRRTGSPAEEEPRTPTSYMLRDTHATQRNTGVDPGDDASGEVSPHGAGGSHFRQATPEVADVSATAHAYLITE